MARLLALGASDCSFFRKAIGSFALLAASASLAAAAAATTNAPPVAPAKTATASAPGKVPGAPGVVLPPPEDYFIRYGKILAPNNQPPYPFKLVMPFPGFGEVKIPGKEELEMREKLERLATLSDADIRRELAKWPAYSKMSLGDEGAMLTRIQQFRDRRNKLAMNKAHDLGLLTLTPAQKTRFETEYWNKRLELDRQLAKEFEPTVKAGEQKLDADLFREFSSPRALAQGPKPPAPPPSPPSPAPGKPAPSADMMMMH